MIGINGNPKGMVTRRVYSDVERSRKYHRSTPRQLLDPSMKGKERG